MSTHSSHQDGDSAGTDERNHRMKSSLFPYMNGEFHGDEESNSTWLGKEGYCDVYLGQQMDCGRYIMMRKLGWGGEATVWLALDTDAGANVFVAIKFLNQRMTQMYLRGDSNEIAILRRIRDAASVHGREAAKRLPLYRHDFMADHERLAIVTEPLGETFRTYLQPMFADETLERYPKRFGSVRDRLVSYVRGIRQRSVSIAVFKKVAIQILEALKFLHDECGVVYRDLKFDNLLFRPPNIDALIARELLLNPSRAYDMEGEVRYGPAAVKPVFASQPLPSWSREREADTLSEIDLVLCDFGFSQFADKNVKVGTQPLALRAPEALMGYPPEKPSDIWNLGCLLYELVTAQHLFHGWAGWKRGGIYPAQDQLYQKMGTLDSAIPKDMMEACPERAQLFDDDGSFAGALDDEFDDPSPSLREAMAEGNAELPSEVLDEVHTFLRRMLCWRPSERATAAELLQDPWLYGKTGEDPSSA